MMRSCVLQRQFLSSMILCLALCCSAKVTADEFLVISDVHFNPMAGLTPRQFRELSPLPADRWPEFLRSLKQPMSSPHSDSNYTLLISALDAAHKRLPDPPFILYTGDFMAHDWQDTYSRLAPETISVNPTAYQNFTRKALAVIAIEFQTRFPDTPVFATLGNDDSFCQDYWIQPGGQFLKTFGSLWAPLLGDAVELGAFRESFEALGVYAADLPGSPSDRLIVLNSVLWSASYCTDYFRPGAINCCNCQNLGATPGKAQFKWLETQLAQAARQKKRVWLLMHVPPGLDSYAEEKASGRSHTAELWTKEFTARFRKLTDGYRDTLRISFAGHTHMDDFRVDRAEDTPVLLHKISPAVSPIFGNNPSFQVFQRDDRTGVISNWQTHFIRLSAASTKQMHLTWGIEYDARTTYGIERVTARSIAQLFLRMKQDPRGSHATAYRRYYAVSASTLAEKDLFIYSCAVLNPTYAAYRHCLTGHGLVPPKQHDEPAQLRRDAGGLK